MKTDIAIVGGGLAGLVAARLLDRVGVDFVLLEARDRLGGRILTTEGFDLGPSWFWPGAQTDLAELVQDLGLDVFAQHLDGDMLVERTHGAPPQRFGTFGQHPPSMRVAGGTGAIVQALAEDLHTDRLRLSAQVLDLELYADGVMLTLSDETTILARRVILAAPPRLLAGSIAFEPKLDPPSLDRWRRTATWMAPHAKFFALYDRPFWRETGLSGAAHSAVGPMTEIHDATTASGAAALFGFLGVGADQRRAVGEEVLVEACIDQLVRLFGPLAVHPSATLFKDWTADPLTATAADTVANGHLTPSHAPWIDGPWAERLSLAGSETSDSEPGYLAGAVQAAQRAVADILRKASR